MRRNRDDTIKAILNNHNEAISKLNDAIGLLNKQCDLLRKIQVELMKKVIDVEARVDEHFVD